MQVEGILNKVKILKNGSKEQLETLDYVKVAQERLRARVWKLFHVLFLKWF